MLPSFAMAEVNPYAAPRNDAEPRGRPVLDEQAVNDSEVIELLKQTRSWVQMLGVLGYLFAGGLGIVGLVLLVLAMSSGKYASPWPGLVCVVVAPLYVFPSMALLRYGRSIGDLVNGQGTPALVDAMRHQKAFWRYAGLLTILFMVLLSVGFSAVSNYINIMNISRM